MATALTGDSPQVVAYRLLENIAVSENTNLRFLRKTESYFMSGIHSWLRFSN